MKIEEYKEINKGSLIASFNVCIPEWGLTIRDCKLFNNGSHSWIGYPSRTYDDPQSGKKKYFSYILFDEKVRSRFENTLKSELEKFRITPTNSDVDLFASEEVPF